MPKRKSPPRGKENSQNEGTGTNTNTTEKKEMPKRARQLLIDSYFKPTTNKEMNDVTSPLNQSADMKTDTDTPVDTDAHTDAHTDIHTDTLTDAHTCTHTDIHTDTPTHTDAHTDTHTRADTDTRAHTDAHTHTLTHTPTYIETELGSMETGWHTALKQEMQKSYFVELMKFVETQRKSLKVYPPPELVFNAFNLTPLNKVKVVIVGQDPYHNPGQAMGLCFSVPVGIKPPPSLINIYKEIKTNEKIPHGDLTSWAEQGVFMLNALLTVVENKPMAHSKKGWEQFTDKVIEVINRELEGVVFLLWGKPAQKKAAKVNAKRHHLLNAGHPSPLSVRFFTGCQHFQKCNDLLSEMGKDPIDWEIKGKDKAE